MRSENICGSIPRSPSRLWAWWEWSNNTAWIPMARSPPISRNSSRPTTACSWWRARLPMRPRYRAPSSAKSTPSIRAWRSTESGPCRTASTIRWRGSALPAPCWAHLRHSRCYWPPWAYGVMSYLVTQGTHDLGVRVALGARPGNIVGLVVRQGMELAAIGILAGLAGSVALTRVMASLLFGVSATDAATFVAVAMLLAAVAFAATVIPARRATRVDPMVALREE